ncbi:MAG: enoyl-CoA hydratase-related protein, partial [Acidimicrobiia bacterium]
MSREHVTVEVDDRVATLTLNRPEKLNAFTGRMGAELGQAYADCDADEAVRAVVLT